MTTTIRGDGILFPDGTLQTSGWSWASAPLMASQYSMSAGIAYKSTPQDVTWAYDQGRGTNVSKSHAVTPHAFATSSILDVGHRWTSIRNYTGSRTVDVNYVNTSAYPLYLMISSTYDWLLHGFAITVDGIRVFSQRRTFPGNHEGNVAAWTVIPSGSTYSVESLNKSSKFKTPFWYEMRD